MEAAVAPQSLVAGYELGEQIGIGGFGEVYRARHTVIGRVAAIKILHRRYSHDAEAVARFVAEARAVNRVSHPGIVEIFDLGTTEDGRQFCVMELIEGRTLRAILDERGRLALDEALPILRGIAEAVDAAHGAGIAHRDLKPDNVFVLPGGGVKLIDFGLAKLVDDTEPNITREGTVFGTPLYMSPEQCRGNTAELRTDTYSFGVVAYQLLTGETPFAGDALEIALHHVNDDPEPPSKRCADVPSRLDAPILAALAKEPADRPSTLGAIVDGLAGASVIRVAARSRAIRRVLLASLAGLVAVSAAALAVMQPWRGESRVTLVPGARGVPYAVITDFASTPDEAWRSYAVAESLESLLEASNGVLVMNRVESAMLQQDLALSASDGHDRATLQAIAAHGPARYVVSGAVSVQGRTMRVRVRLEDAVVGTTLAVVERTGDAAHIAPIVAQVAADLRQRSGLPPLSARDIEEASHVLPRDELVEPYILAAHRQYRTDFRGLVRALDPVIAAQPDFPLAHVVRAFAVQAMGQEAEGVAELTAAQAHSAGLPGRRRLEIDLFKDIRTSDVEQAKVLVKRALAERPSDTLLQADLVQSLTRAGYNDEATELLETLKRLPAPDGQEPIIDLVEARLADAQRKLPEVAKAAHRGAERARQARGRYALMENLTIEGSALSTMMRPDDAIPVLEEATRVAEELDLFDLRPFFVLRDVYFGLARIDDARRMLDKIYELRLNKGASTVELATAMHVVDHGLLDRNIGDVASAYSACAIAHILYLAAGEPPRAFSAGKGIAEVPRRCVAWARDAHAGVRRPTVDAARIAVDAARRNAAIDLVVPLETLGNALWDAGRYAEAEARFDELASVYAARGSHRRVGWARASMAEMAVDAGEPARARTFAQQAIDEFRQSKGDLGEAFAKHLVALAYLAEGDAAAARAAIAPSEAYVAKLQNLEFRVRMLAWEGVVKGDLAVADEAVAQAVTIDNYTTITHAKLMRARVLQQLGRDAEARTELSDVLARARRIGQGEWERQAKRLLTRR